MEIIAIAIALAMDAFVVSICLGISNKDITAQRVFNVSLSFGFFQAFMPIIGWYLSFSFGKYIKSFDHWIAFLILAFIGSKMIFEALKEQNRKTTKVILATILLLSIATSIDALAVGVAFAIIDRAIFTPAVIIGIVAFCFSVIGIKGGSFFGKHFRKGTEIFGGLILILIGVRILIEHLFLL
ncbi:MAG: manganese efflux pump MntP family protein [Kosmotogaceae bacterium]